MLQYFIPNLKESKFIKLLESFYRSIYYVIFIGLITLCSSLFGLEVPTYIIFTVIGLLIPCFLCDDLTGALAPTVMAYVTFSLKNNASGGNGLLSHPWFKTFMLIIGITLATFFILRLIVDLIKRKPKHKPHFGIGFIVLGIGYLMGGMFSGLYEGKSTFFGLIEILCLCVFYFIYLYTINYEKLKKEYFAYIFLVLGFVLNLEVIGRYLEVGLDTVFTSFNRGLIQTGWGCYNNIGGEIAMCLAAPLYLALKKKKGIIYIIISAFFAIGLFLSQSRGAMVMGAVTYLVSFIVLLVKADKNKRKQFLLTYLILFILLVVTIIIFKDQILVLFKDVITSSTRDDLNSISSGRIEIYKAGFEQYFEHPICGVGFYQAKVYRFENFNLGNFFPPRYHNTIVQIFACTGTVGALAYLFHRYQTIKFVLKKPSLENIFIGLTILGLLLTALLDCHMFNLGPDIQYGVLLALMEGLTLLKKD